MKEARYIIVPYSSRNMSLNEQPSYNFTSTLTNENRTYFSDLVEVAGVRYTLVVLHVLTILLAAVGNGRLIYFILKNHKLRTNVTAYLVLNLAVCDLVTTCVHQPMRLADILMPFTSGGGSVISTTYCQVMEFLAALFAGVAFHTIVAISQERHLLVCYPLRTREWLTVCRIKTLLGTLWGLSFVALLPAYAWYTFVASVPLRNANLTFCMVDIVERSSQRGVGYFLFLFCLYFILPTLAISVTYGRIFYVLSRGLSVVEGKDQRFAKVMAARKRLAKLMLGIAIVFIVFHAPFFVTYLLVSQGYGIQDNPVFVLLVIEFLGSINSVFNPFIYSANSKTLFRKKMVSFLGAQETDSQTGTPRHESAGMRWEHRTADGVPSLTPTPSKKHLTRSSPTPPSRPKQCQTIVSLHPQPKPGVQV